MTDSKPPAGPSEFEKALNDLMLKLTGIGRYDGAILEDAIRAAHAREVANAVAIQKYGGVCKVCDKHAIWVCDNNPAEQCVGCLVEREVAAARHENPDSEWRRQMEAYGYDSVAKVMDLIAAARREAFEEAANARLV